MDEIIKRPESAEDARREAEIRQSAAASGPNYEWASIRFLLAQIATERAKSEGLRYRIDEYDGNESVMTADDYEWTTADDGERRDTVSDLLLPCPFCGQKAYIRKRDRSMPRDPTYQAYCDDCGCGTSDLYRQPALAIQAWNQRALAEIEPAPSDGGER